MDGGKTPLIKTDSAFRICKVFHDLDTYVRCFTMMTVTKWKKTFFLADGVAWLDNVSDFQPHREKEYYNFH